MSDDQQPTFLSNDQLLSHLQWRYAVKKFDPNRKIASADWHTLEQSLILTPSSFGLQPWKFFVVETPETREALVAHSWGQKQVVEASHLVVLAIKAKVSDADVDHYIARTAEVRQVPAADLAPFAKVIKDFLQRMDTQAQQRWAKLQVYIALGQLMTSAAHLGIDTCPMEGFDPDQYDNILGLPEKGYSAAVVCPVGYRDPADPYAHYPKVRFPQDEMIETL
ncbi:NAD(P)H-dependent oxidoreductase [Lyngbya confervoides]|uniref:NAD(P)H-dependent oxidoreductase n=1 Tax=Lyngbya confervoides BDU141951 TaxID=1574623 RepID=A0ABD4T5D2_9CYAN|nr:NAD(P)H-dependent oxidoreductase [Lyngbya confervoides]MCM1983685.1 NAD(P)H-dependent oxidoreductase [Lyngbya confervoides BDU141951]